jgi:hypothetical protein
MQGFTNARRWLVLVASLILALGACSESRERLTPPSTSDTTAPAAISDFATGRVTPSTVNLTWTAPGDDGSTGTAHRYDLRYATSTITDTGFSFATPVGGLPAPAAAGTAESFTVTGLSPGTPYHFALKTADEVPNWSSLSNVPNVTTVANSAPDIDTLTVSAPAAAPGDTLTLRCEAHDADADSLSYSWQATAGTIEGAGAQVRWTAPGTEGIHRVTVTVTDRWDGSDTDTVTTASDAFGGTLLLQTRAGIIATDPFGHSFVFYDSGAGVEVLGEHIFVTGFSGITEVDHQGQRLTTVVSNPRVSGYVTLLPDLGFAVVTNDTDLIYLVSPAGTVLDTIPIPNADAEKLQGIDGVAVGNQIVISENGNGQLFAVDLTTHAASIFRSVQDGRGWLGAIDHRGGVFCLCRSRRIHEFTPGGDLRDVCTLPVGNITGVVTTGRFAYVVVNLAGELYRVDRTTGEYQVVLDGLDYPQDIEAVPVRLGQP